MKIKVIQSIAGHAEPKYDLADFAFPPGCVVEVKDVLAEAWIEGGIALRAEKSDKLTMPVEVYTLTEEQKAKLVPAPAAPAPDLDEEAPAEDSQEDK